MRNKVVGMAIVLLVVIALGITTYEVRELSEKVQKQSEETDKAIKELREEIDQVKDDMPEFIGTFTTTAYCKCEKCCGIWTDSPTKSGTIPQEGRTIAVDPDIIPLGTQVIINDKVYTAEDTGSAVKGNVIDIYFSDHEETEEYGRQEKNIWITSNT